MSAVRVVVADDQTVVRDGLVTLLKLLPGIDVVAAASDGEEALQLVAEHNPDVLLVDLRMPRCDGVEATRRVRAEHPGTEVVVLTTYSDDETVLSALRAGARGFLTKDADAESIGRALQAAAAGQSIVDAEVQRIIELGHGPSKGVPSTGEGDRSRISSMQTPGYASAAP